MTTLQDMKKLAEINVESGDARTKSNAKQTLILIEVMERKYEALGEALKAIETLPDDCFGYVENHGHEQPYGWTVKLELLDKMNKALAAYRKIGGE